METGIDETKCLAVGEILKDPNRSLAERFRALFTLRNLGGATAVSAIAACFDDSSELLKHECAYCLGQMQDTRAIPILSTVLCDTNQQTMVRHEAGEALGAIGSDNVLDLLSKYCDDPVVEVAETCQLAVERIRWLHGTQRTTEKLSENPYRSVDPAPPCADMDTETLRRTLMDESRTLFDRYRAMFALRNKCTDDSVRALAEGLNCNSALFRHEVAYVLGQMQNSVGVKQLMKNLADKTESAMVRHECAEALGSIATDQCMEILEAFAKDHERVVAESCEVALDMGHHEHSNDFQYADGLERV